MTGWPLHRVAVFLALAAAACASPGAPQRNAGEAKAFYAYAGSRQCSGGGKTAEALRRELASAGVQAISVQCGHDGRMYVSSCGNPDGAILIAMIPAAEATSARRLGLEPLEDLPEATKSPCR